MNFFNPVYDTGQVAERRHLWYKHWPKAPNHQICTTGSQKWIYSFYQNYSFHVDGNVLDEKSGYQRVKVVLKWKHTREVVFKLSPNCGASKSEIQICILETFDNAKFPPFLESELSVNKICTFKTDNMDWPSRYCTWQEHMIDVQNTGKTVKAGGCQKNDCQHSWGNLYDM